MYLERGQVVEGKATRVALVTLTAAAAAAAVGQGEVRCQVRYRRKLLRAANSRTSARDVTLMYLSGTV